MLLIYCLKPGFQVPEALGLSQPFTIWKSKLAVWWRIFFFFFNSLLVPDGWLWPLLCVARELENIAQSEMEKKKHRIFGIKADERESTAWRFAEGNLYKDRILQQTWGWPESSWYKEMRQFVGKDTGWWGSPVSSQRETHPFKLTLYFFKLFFKILF